MLTICRMISSNFERLSLGFNGTIRSTQGLVEVDIPPGKHFRLDHMIQIGQVEFDPIEQVQQTLH